MTGESARDGSFDVGGGDAVDLSEIPLPELPNDLAAISATLFALRGSEAAAYRALAGEYLVLAVEVELALDALLSLWFLEMDEELYNEFDTILQRIGLERKLQTVKRLVKNESGATGALMARVDRVQRLRNKIAHQSPTIDGSDVRFNDETLTATKFEAELKAARELPLELLDGLFPQIVERRRRWGARDVDVNGRNPEPAVQDAPFATET